MVQYLHVKILKFPLIRSNYNPFHFYDSMCFIHFLSGLPGKFSDASKADADASPEDAEAAEGAEEEVKEEDPPLEEIQGQDAQNVD